MLSLSNEGGSNDLIRPKMKLGIHDTTTTTTSIATVTVIRSCLAMSFAFLRSAFDAGSSIKVVVVVAFAFGSSLATNVVLEFKFVKVIARVGTIGLTVSSIIVFSFVDAPVAATVVVAEFHFILILLRRVALQQVDFQGALQFRLVKVVARGVTIGLTGSSKKVVTVAFPLGTPVVATAVITESMFVEVGAGCPAIDLILTCALASCEIIEA